LVKIALIDPKTKKVRVIIEKTRDKGVESKFERLLAREEVVFR